MVGVLENVEQRMTMAFKQPGHSVALIGTTKAELGGSEYLALLHGLDAGRPPVLELPVEIALHHFMLDAIKRGLIESAHDCSEGGLAVAIAESAIAGNLGVDIAVPLVERADATLFGESQSRIVISFDEKNAVALTVLAAEANVPFDIIGMVGGDSLLMEVDGTLLVDMPLADAIEAFTTAIPQAMEK